MIHPPTKTDELDDVSAPDVVHQQLLAAGHFAYQECDSCRGSVYPPRILCPLCGGTTLLWKASAGTGSIYSISTISPRDEDPYTVALVDVDEGFRVMTNVTGPTASIGDRVSVEVVERNGRMLPLFSTGRQE
ncbi:hypothetical protein BH09ACT6_BH09ACT6_05390 [soil metagenome]